MCVKPHSPDLNRGALATDARGCSLWRTLLERPPPTQESRVRDPLGESVRTRGSYTYTVSSALYTVSSAPYTVCIAPYTVSSALYTVSSAPYTVCIAPYTVSIAPYIVCIASYSLSRESVQVYFTSGHSFTDLCCATSSHTSEVWHHTPL